MDSKKPRFLADESIEYRIILHLRKKDYDVSAIYEISPALNDKEVLSKAYENDRTLLTNDKDFGDLVYLNNLPHKGIILLRIKNEKVEEKIKALNKLLEKYLTKLKNSFIVVEKDKIRIRM